MPISPDIPASSSQNCESNSSDHPCTGPHPGRALLLEDVFSRACTWIAGAHRDSKLSPAGIAQQLRCSRATLYRAFQSKGITVADYIQRLRLEQIHTDLATAAPRIPISSIALDHGFECLSHFHRRFKRLYGHTPGETRSARSPQRREVRN
ncbi:AraC family transcriptional regulator [Rhodanobacter denitrificans]|uniref:AraC family transcriptional regulator n=1 Tax=Rhodanobacter denitrificans TaxID=666685 RepID=A0A368KHP8_9GAMM|nr:AraC family transcriptional regulator [Rhodanobacter denitrificans]